MENKTKTTGKTEADGETSKLTAVYFAEGKRILTYSRISRHKAMEHWKYLEEREGKPVMVLIKPYLEGEFLGGNPEEGLKEVAEQVGKTGREMRTEKEVRVTLEAWKQNPEVNDPEYQKNPGKLIVEILEWVVGDR
jgi:hypothetical protein